jgi:hypothetical protein
MYMVTKKSLYFLIFYVRQNIVFSICVVVLEFLNFCQIFQKLNNSNSTTQGCIVKYKYSQTRFSGTLPPILFSDPSLGCH